MKTPFKYLPEEHETFIHWDYYAKRVWFCTTKQRVFQQFVKRCKDIPDVKINENEMNVSVPIEYGRSPWMAMKRKKVDASL